MVIRVLFCPRNNSQWPQNFKNFCPRFDALHFCPILILEREPVFPFFTLSWVLNKGTTRNHFLTSLVWRGHWLGIEPRHPRTRSPTLEASTLPLGYPGGGNSASIDHDIVVIFLKRDILAGIWIMWIPKGRYRWTLLIYWHSNSRSCWPTKSTEKCPTFDDN